MNIARTFLSILLIAPALAVAAEMPPEKLIIIWDDKLGIVTFPHEEHGLRVNEECTICHHTLKEGEEVQVCNECHKDELNPIEGYENPAVKWEDAYHTRCTECHLETIALGQTAGPIKCLTCHLPRP